MDGPTVANVKAAKNPQEALLYIAAACDMILAKLDAKVEDDGWGEWVAPEPGPIPGPAATVEHDAEGNATVTLKPVTVEKQMRRRTFAEEVLKLRSFAPDMHLEEDDAIE